MKDRADIATVINRFLPKLRQKRGLSKQQLKVSGALSRCRTSQLGGAMMACRDCGEVHYILHSCRDRHCPRCQGIDKELWVEARKAELLPVKYYHVVFTVTHDLLEVFKYNRKTMYNLLFECAWDTLNTFAKDTKWLGAQAGAIAVLHTWDQKLKYHPHVHFIVPAGGLDDQKQWKNTKQNGNFLFDVKQMSPVFSARFVKRLRQLKKEGKIKKFVPRDLIKKPWGVYAKKAFGSPDNVLEYLGRYTHRVAISNARIIEVTDTHVTFSWHDRKNNYQKKVETLSGEVFLERFIEHIVPPYFRRIRHYGFLGSRNKSKALKAARDSLKVINIPQRLLRTQVLELRYGKQSLLQCKSCGGELVLIVSYTKERAPPVPDMIATV